MITDILEAINQYSRVYRHPALPKLSLSGLYALFPGEDKVAPNGIEINWPAEWPNVSQKGVYFVFGSGGRLLYIGKASMNGTLGARLNAYFKIEKTTGMCQVIQPSWTEKPMYIATLPVPEDMGFEAAALEEYLIRELKPPDNTRGKA